MSETPEIELEDTLNPSTEWIDDGCFRINKKQELSGKSSNAQSTNTLKTFTEDEELIQHDEINDVDVEVMDNGRFKTTICIPHTFYGFIIGAKGNRCKRIEEETKTEISIPRQSNNNKIIITGASERSVLLARNRLEMIDFDLRNTHRITHFISFPMASKEIKKNFEKFKDLILAEGHIGVEESIFQKPEKLHLTIAVCVLLDDFERNKAEEMLDSLKTDIIDPMLKSCEPLVITMEGLEYMNDDPSAVDVLYAKVKVNNNENPEILQHLSNAILNYSTSKGITKTEKDFVKLHATLINTRYRKDADGGSLSRSRDRKWKRIAIDARPIMDKFSNFYFGEQVLDFIHLSCKSLLDEKTGYYKDIHTIPCN